MARQGSADGNAARHSVSDRLDDQADHQRSRHDAVLGDDGKIVRQSEEEIESDGAMRYTTTYPYQGPKRYYSGGGGLCSTAEDYFRFCQMLLDNGRFQKKRVLSRKSVELMTVPHVPFEDGNLEEGGMGLGLVVTGQPGHFHEPGSPGAYGGGGFFYTGFFIDPKEELVGITLVQLHPAGDVDWLARFPTLVYQAIDD